MTPEYAVQIVRQALIVSLWLGLPLLTAAFVVGIIVNLFQVATSMQDTAVGTVPRLAAILVALLVSLPWMLNQLIAYAAGIIGNLGRYAN